jgi:hypothetical protein
VNPNRVRAAPDWIWFLAFIAGILVFGFVANVGYPAIAHPRPLQVAAMIAGGAVYMYPGWRLSRYVQRKTASAAWSEYVGLAALLAWVGVAWLLARALSGMGY